MEQRDILSAGQSRLTREELERRLAVAAPPGRRAAPLPPDAPRGDHDLNPDLYMPERALVPAAVLIPVVTRRAGLNLLFTRRADHLDVHAGQISFPGGRLEPADAGPEAAALRETEEEVGLPRRHVELIGRLDTYVTRTGFEITPVLGLVTPPFPVVPDSFEVAEVFEAPLDFFLTPHNRQRDTRVYEGRARHFYAFPYRSHYIWGATAGILVNLGDVLAPPREG
jgi:8-oxo-dGTP pyrophosphatase MutT (NUDIX family)